jgi:T5SS/PEP-CTERM-associated repeat protein
LNITNGAVASSTTSIVGQFTTAQGTVSVTGANSTWNNSNFISIGEFGKGELTISGGGKVVDGGASIGFPSSTFGSSSSTNGKVLVTGEGSTWTNNGSLLIAGSSFGFPGTGTGELTVAAGGAVSSVTGVVGNSSGYTGTVTITGSNSAWSNTLDLTIGNRGNGTLIIADGGKVTSATGIIGQSTSGNGTVSIAGVGSSWSLGGGIAVGSAFSSQALVTISPGGTLTAGGETLILSHGTVKLEGGTFTTSAIKFQGTGGQFNWTSGTLHVGTYNGNLVNSAGVLAPGQSAGTTTVTGNFTQQAAGILQIEIGGITAGTQFDTLAVTGTANLGGTLQVELISSFVPASGDTFDILNLTTHTGAFSAVQLPMLPVGLIWNSSQLYSTGRISISAAPPGDFNSDGDVDGADFVAWQTNFPLLGGATLSQGDADRDGDVDGADFVVWQTHFPTTPGPAGSPVPEPTALILAFGALATMRWLNRPAL